MIENVSNIMQTTMNVSANYTSILNSDVQNSSFALLESNINGNNDSVTFINDIVANVTTAAYEFTTNWIFSTLTTPTAAATTTTTIGGSSISGDVGNVFGNITTNYNLSGSRNVSTVTHEYMEDDYEYAPCHPDNPNFNCTPQEYLEAHMGLRQMPFVKAILITIIFGGIFLTGVVGNVLVCVVIVKHSIMHTATNYYLFSLAVSDLLYLLFGLPAEVFLYWHQYPYLFGLPFCKIRALISEASTYVSVLTIVAFSMERFLAICHPLHLYAMSGFKRAVRIIAVLWVISYLSAIPFCMMTGIRYEVYPVDNSTMMDSAYCLAIDFPENFPLFELSFCIFFVIPMILIIVLYWKMGKEIRSRTIQQLGVQQNSMQKESRHQQSKKAVIRMLAAVVITFFICWLPFHMQRLWYLYTDDRTNEINEWIISLTGFAYYVSCTINPILYNVMSKRYRQAFKDILCRKRKSVYYNNGFARDQSSFRDTIATSLGGSTNYDRVHSVRVRSMRQKNNVRDRDSIKSNSVLWSKKSEYSLPMQQNIPEDSASLSTNVIVVVDNGINGRPKVYTENEAQESFINKNNETCI